MGVSVDVPKHMVVKGEIIVSCVLNTRLCDLCIGKYINIAAYFSRSCSLTGGALGDPKGLLERK